MSVEKEPDDRDLGSGPAAGHSLSHLDPLPGYRPDLAYDEQEARRVRRKLDLRVLPVCLYAAIAIVLFSRAKAALRGHASGSVRLRLDQTDRPA